MTSQIKQQQQQQTAAINQLSTGLLREFTSLRDLEVHLEQIVSNQQKLIQNIMTLGEFYTNNGDYMEVQLMVS